MRKRPREDSVLSQRKFFKKTAKGKVIKSEPGLNLILTPLIMLPQYSENVICETMYRVESSSALSASQVTNLRSHSQ